MITRRVAPNKSLHGTCNVGARTSCGVASTGLSTKPWEHIPRPGILRQRSAPANTSRTYYKINREAIREAVVRLGQNF